MCVSYFKTATSLLMCALSGRAWSRLVRGKLFEIPRRCSVVFLGTLDSVHTPVPSAAGLHWLCCDILKEFRHLQGWWKPRLDPLHLHLGWPAPWRHMQSHHCGCPAEFNLKKKDKINQGGSSVLMFTFTKWLVSLTEAWWFNPTCLSRDSVANSSAREVAIVCPKSR